MIKKVNHNYLIIRSSIKMSFGWTRTNYDGGDMTVPSSPSKTLALRTFQIIFFYFGENWPATVFTTCNFFSYRVLSNYRYTNKIRKLLTVRWEDFGVSLETGIIRTYYWEEHSIAEKWRWWPVESGAWIIVDI